jgi:GNAT superfamily N-acetyltransferase
VSAHDSVRIERVGQRSLDFLAPLVEDSEAQRVRFVRRLVDEWTSGVNRFDLPGEELFVAWSGARPGDAAERSAGAVDHPRRVIGVGGLNIDPYVTARGVGRVRHVYVLTSDRRSGVGAQLVKAIVDAAHGRFEVLRLRTGNPAAAHLYERLGFERVDLPECTHTMALTVTVR